MATVLKAYQWFKEQGGSKAARCVQYMDSLRDAASGNFVSPRKLGAKQVTMASFILKMAPENP